MALSASHAAAFSFSTSLLCSNVARAHTSRRGTNLYSGTYNYEDETTWMKVGSVESSPPSTAPLPGSPLQMICDERREFELNLGKVMDTLKKDYPKMLTRAPDFSIFHDDLEVVDPSGVTIHGIPNYEMSFRVVRSVVGFFYCEEASGLTFRLVYDWARNNIRVSWNAELTPRSIYGGASNTLYVDGISVYDMDRSSGLISQHRIEHLLVNGNPVHAPNGLFNAMQEEVSGIIPVPGGFGVADSTNVNPNQIMEFRRDSPLSTLFPKPSLFAPSMTQTNSFDTDAFDRKNLTRKKFGLPPLTPEEFEEVLVETQVIETQQKLKQSHAAAAALEQSKKNEKKSNFFTKLLDDALSDYSCKSNYDCERPMVCCDFKFKKICCASGQKVPAGAQRATVPVPASELPNPGQDNSLPRGGPDGMRF